MGRAVPDGGPVTVRRVLAVGAHPDDIEILCGGTMARYRREGVEVTLATATDGNRGGMGVAPEELGAVRRKEAAASAEEIGAHYVSAGLPDGGVNPTDEAMRQVMVDVVREARPDVVFTHHPDDYHADHAATSKLVLDATFSASVPLHVSDEPATTGIPPVLFMDTLAGIGFLPEEYVDISDIFPVKRSMLSRHASQIRWMREHDGIELLDFMEVMGRFRGIQCGVAHAEGFTSRHAWLRQTPRRLLPG